MRSALLPGREHCQIGAIELIAEGSCAIAISRGGAAKNYSHTDPNEDACLFAHGPGGSLIGVADGHHGAQGSELALRHLLESWAEEWTAAPAIEPTSFQAAAESALAEANQAIIDEAERCDLPPSPTTLSIALVRPSENRFFHASVGDSHVFCVNPSEARDLGWAAERREHPHFLGDTHHRSLTERREISWEPLDRVTSIVLVTDGFSEAGIGFDDPAAAMAGITQGVAATRTEIRAVQTCRSLADATVAIQRKNRSGDNIACAVWASDVAK